MTRLTLELLLAVSLLLALSCAPALAGGIPIAGLDVQASRWLPFDPDHSAQDILDVRLKVIEADGPAAPSTLDELLPWAIANFRVDIPFSGDRQTLLKPLGLGASETAQIGAISGTPIFLGIGYLTSSGWCLFGSTTLFAFDF